MSDFEVIETLEDGRTRIRFTCGALTGRTVWAFPSLDPWPEPPSRRSKPRRRESPEARAARLLRSLLSPEQRRDWVTRRRFLVETQFGKVELGELFNIGFWPATGGELRLCVVPTGKTLPGPDIWTNLLLVLKTDPVKFFKVANWRRPPNTTWYFGPVPGFSAM